MRWSLVSANEKLIIFLTVAMGGGRRSESSQDAGTDAHNVVYYDRDHVEANDGASQDYGDNDPASGTTSRGGVAHASKRGGGGKDAIVWWDISQSQASQMSQYSAGEDHHDHDRKTSHNTRSTNRQLPSSSTTTTPRFLSRDERRKRSRMAQEQQQRQYEHSDSSSDDDDDNVSDGGNDGDGPVEEGSEDPFATIMGSQNNDDSDNDDSDDDGNGGEGEEMDNNDSQYDHDIPAKVHDKTPADQQMAEEDNVDDNDYDDDPDDFPIPDQSLPTSPAPADDVQDEYGSQHNSMYASRGGNRIQKSTASNYAGELHYDDDGDCGYVYGVDDGGCGGIDMNALRRQSMKRSIGSTKSSSKHSTRQSMSMTTSMTASRSISSKKRSRSSFAGFGGGRGMTMHDDDDLMSDLTNAAGGNTDMLVAARKAVASGRGSIGSAKQSRSKKTSAQRNDNSSNDTGVKKAKSSIVGSRPMHWGGGLGRKSFSSTSKQRQVESSASAKVAKKKLSDATRRSTMDRLASASRRKSRAKGAAAPKTPASSLSRAAASASSSGTGGTTAHTPKSKGSKSAETPGTAASSSSKWERHVNLREMEFAPAFISSRPSDANAGAAMGLSIQDDVALTPNGHQSHPQSSQGVTPVRFNLDGTNTGDGSMDANMASSISATPCLSGKRSRKRAKAMGLTKLLRDIRSASDGDCMRLKSGANQAPRDLTRRRRMTDVSDPRNRATLYIDVTLLGDPIPWEGGIKRTTILGYVHSTHVQKADDVVKHMLPKAEAFAWVILDYDTINEKRIARGTQLRIYDPTLIPSLEDLPSTIACTKVCELYPTDLPPLFRSKM